MSETLNLKRDVTCVVKNRSLTLLMHNLYGGINGLHFKSKLLINRFSQIANGNIKNGRHFGNRR